MQGKIIKICSKPVYISTRIVFVGVEVGMGGRIGRYGLRGKTKTKIKHSAQFVDCERHLVMPILQ